MGSSSRSGSRHREGSSKDRKGDRGSSRHRDDDRRSSGKDKRRHRDDEVLEEEDIDRKRSRKDKSSGRKRSRDDRKTDEYDEQRRSKHSSRKRSRDEENDDGEGKTSRKSSHKHHRRDRDRPRSSSEDDGSNPRKHRQKHKKDDRKKEKSRDKDERKHRSSSSNRDDEKDKKKKKDHRKKHSKDDTKNKKDKAKNDTENVPFRVLKQQSRPPQKSLQSLGNPLGHAPSTLLDATTDYFTYHQQFWVWLYRQHGMAFNDLASEQSHEAFGEFVEHYNAGRLEAAYYTGLPPDAIEECKTTQHKWSFQTSETERRGLLQLQEGVRKLTEYSDPNAKDNDGSQNFRNDKNKQRQPRSMVPARADTKNDDDDDDPRNRRWTPEQRLAHRAANKRLREHVQTAEEEFGGGRADYGRERQLEKKRELAAKMHGSAKDREEARMGGVEVSDRDLYGDDGRGDSFQAALAREKKRKAQREEKQSARVQELQQKEQSKQEAMLKMLGLSNVQPGQKIAIAPRSDAGNGGTK